MIGERLSDIRKDHHDTQQKLADKLNVALPTVRSWEQGKSSPSHEMLIEICKLYGISADYLLGLTSYDKAYLNKIQKDNLSDDDVKVLKDFQDYLISRSKNNHK